MTDSQGVVEKAGWVARPGSVGPIRGLALCLLFLLELAVLAVGVRWGWALGAPLPARLLAAVAVPSLLAGLWGALGSPRARVPLRPPAKRAFQAGWFVLGGVMLALLGQVWLGVGLVVVWVAVTVLLRGAA
ncbi:YrdB family protein [Micromonospora sp. WMMD729]|uniref:YrdB family protein n=1 Tax=Micromonospora sp. WMMD729 TaxID=3404127 RepID=UPI003BF5094F